MLNTAPSSYRSAIFGETRSTTGAAVYGWANTDSGTATGVLGETATPDGYGVAGNNTDDTGTGEAVGVRGTSSSTTGVGMKGKVWAPEGYGVYGFNESTSGDAIGVYGETRSANGFAGYFDGRGYFSGNVGIGTEPTGLPLTVAGVVQSTLGGFRFPDGTFQTTAAIGGGSSLWAMNGSDIFYNAGLVGVGWPTPEARLHVGGGWNPANTEGDFTIGDGMYRLTMGVDTSGVGAGHCRILAAGPMSKLTLGANGHEHVTVSSTGVGKGNSSATCNASGG